MQQQTIATREEDLPQYHNMEDPLGGLFVLVYASAGMEPQENVIKSLEIIGLPSALSTTHSTFRYIKSAILGSYTNWLEDV